MTRDWCSAVPAGIRLALQITPNAKKTEVIGVLDDSLKIRLQAQPIDGKANEALIRYLADTLNVAKSAVDITHGLTSKRKVIEIRTSRLIVEDVRQALVQGSGGELSPPVPEKFPAY
ncbi:MAG: uncharacterized protein V7606_996 [Burkholderiales bacterium]|jgi:uncharacterized protein (TIGR00251 family)